MKRNCFQCSKLLKTSFYHLYFNNMFFEEKYLDYEICYECLEENDIKLTLGMQNYSKKEITCTYCKIVLIEKSPYCRINYIKSTNPTFVYEYYQLCPKCYEKKIGLPVEKVYNQG